jgi:hypothetical protein
MEPGSTQDFTEYEKLAHDIYNGADKLFESRHIPSLYEKIPIRHNSLTLTEQELARIGMLLETYAIDAPDYTQLIIENRNPYKDANFREASLQIIMRQRDMSSRYGVYINRFEVQSAKATKHVSRPTEVYHVGNRLGRDELTALNSMIEML